MNVAPGATYEAVIDWGITGATIGMRVIDNEGATTVARVTGFTEYPAGSGIYSLTGNTAPSDGGQYTLVYDDDGGTAAIGHVATEDLLVTHSLGVGVPSSPYATVDELARLLKVNATTFSDQLTEVLVAAAGEIDSELGILSEDGEALSEQWQLALAAQVNIERAAEHWQQRAASFGIVGFDAEGPVRLARDTWDRHAHKLAPLKQIWGLA